MQEMNTLKQRVRSLESDKFQIGETIDSWKKKYKILKAEHAKLKVEMESKRKMGYSREIRVKRRHARSIEGIMVIKKMAEAVYRARSSLLVATAFIRFHQNLSDFAHHFIYEMRPASFMSIFFCTQ